MRYATRHLGEIAAATQQHVLLVAAGLLLGLLVALPLGVLAARNRRTSSIVLGTLGAIYTIPSLALLAIAVRYLGLGFVPVVLVLAAYAQFILVRTIAAGIAGVPEETVDAARGLGMSALQRLVRVELPLALPILIGGLRLATIALIAIATLGGYAGAGGLGNDIFLGLQRQYVTQTLAGSIPAALLAIAADLCFRALERWSQRRIHAIF